MIQELEYEAYLLSLNEFNDNDAIGIFFVTTGDIIRLKVLGYQKPTSKNRLQLRLFAKIRIEYFQNPNFGNAGKLKRATLLNETIIDSQYNQNLTLLVKHLIINNKKVSRIIYLLIDELFMNLNNPNYNFFVAIIYLMYLIILNENYKLTINRCAICKSTKNIISFSLDYGGLICRNCNKRLGLIHLDENFLKKIIKLTTTFNFDELQSIIFDPNEERILLELFKLFLTNNLGIDTYYLKDF